MEVIDKIFTYYDSLIVDLPIGYQAIISAGLVLFLFWNVYIFIRKGHWIFLAILLIALPGTWPALRNLGYILWKVVINLVFRIQGV